MIASRRVRRLLSGPAGVALAVLLLHGGLAVLIPLPSYFRKYALAAEHRLSGVLPIERLMDFSPLYFRLSVLAERLLPHPEAAVHWLQVVLGAISTGLLYGLLRHRFATPLALAVTAVFAIDRHLLVYERILEPEALMLFFLLAFLYCVEVDRPVLAGLFAALSLATRPILLPVFLLTPLYFRLHAGEHPGRPWWWRSLGFLAPVLAMSLLLMARAWTVTGDPRTPMMNPGTVFFEGNNPLSQGTSAIYPPIVLELVRHAGDVPDSAHLFYRTVARADAGRELSIAGVNAYWSARATAFLRAEPGRWLRLLREKLVRAFHGFRWHDVPTAWHYERRIPIPTVSFALVSSLALIGLLFEVRKWRHSLLLYAAGFVQLGVMLAFYVSARQRMVLVPIALYFAAAGVERMLASGRRGLLLGLLAAMMSLVFLLPDDLMRDESYRRRGYLETDRLLHESREKTDNEPIARHVDLAVAAIASAPWWLDWLRPAYFPSEGESLEGRLADALAERPRDLFAASADFDRAAVLIEAGRMAEAERLLVSLIENDAVVYRGGRQPSDPRLLLGRVHALQGEDECARALLESALERSPGDPFALAELIALSPDDEAHDRALLDAYWSRLDAEYLLGRAYLRHGRPREALEAFRFVADRLPEYREVRVLAAAALADLGRYEKGAREYLEASRIRLEPIVAGPRIAELFRRWAQANPERPDVGFYAVQVLHQHGYFREALALLEGLELPPAMSVAAQQERRRIAEAIATQVPWPSSRPRRGSRAPGPESAAGRGSPLAPGRASDGSGFPRAGALSGARPGPDPPGAIAPARDDPGGSPTPRRRSCRGRPAGPRLADRRIRRANPVLRSLTAGSPIRASPAG